MSSTAMRSSSPSSKVARAYPRRELHVVVDNYATHKHPDVEAWLAKHRRVTLHFTPTSGSWLNLVEVFFSIITRQAILSRYLRQRQGPGGRHPPCSSTVLETTVAIPSPGPKPPTRFSATRDRVRGLQTQDTSARVTSDVEAGGRVGFGNPHGTGHSQNSS